MGIDEILEKRFRKGKVEYLVSWVGYGPDENTWEPKDNMMCPEMIETYEQSLKEQNETLEKVKPLRNKEAKAGVNRGHLEQSVAERVPEVIVGATKMAGKQMFLLKWNGVDECDLVL